MKTVNINGQALKIKRPTSGTVYTSYYRKGILYPYDDPKYITVGYFKYLDETVAYCIKDSILPKILCTVLLSLLLLLSAYFYLPTYLKNIPIGDVVYNVDTNILTVDIQPGFVPIYISVTADGTVSDTHAITLCSHTTRIKTQYPYFKEDTSDGVIRISSLDVTLEKPIIIRREET